MCWKQATIQGFEAEGYSKEEGEAMLRRSVEISHEARETYQHKCAQNACDCITNGRSCPPPILVAASVGSYGAYLADGSEYRSTLDLHLFTFDIHYF